MNGSVDGADDGGTAVARERHWVLAEESAPARREVENMVDDGEGVLVAVQHSEQRSAPGLVDVHVTLMNTRKSRP